MNEFEELYRNGGWDNEGSGPGSTEEFTREFRGVFQKTLAELKIKSVFDLGCGDWQWQQHMDWTGIRYEGWDISKTAIEQCWGRMTGKADCLQCYERDAFIVPLWPEADLLLVKDVVHHISPFRVRMLIERAKLYNQVLWVVDVHGERDAAPINWHGDFHAVERLLTFNIAPPYRYGPKMAFMLTNP